VTCYGDAVYVSGFFSGTTCTPYNADGTPFRITLPRFGTLDAYMACYTTAGAVTWIAHGASSATTRVSRFDVDSTGVYFPGDFSGTPVKIYGALGQATGPDLTQLGTQSGFISKLTL
jgi:hypothetical protein